MKTAGRLAMVLAAALLVLLAGCAREEKPAELKMLSGKQQTGELYYQTELCYGPNINRLICTDFTDCSRDVRCRRPGCSHADADCGSCYSAGGYDSVLLNMEGELYILERGTVSRESKAGDEKDLMKLWRVKPDCEGYELVHTFPYTQHARGDVAGDGKKLYFPIDEWSENLFGSVPRIAVLDLETGEVSTPLRLRANESWLGCAGREIWLCEWEWLSAGQAAGINAAVSPGSGMHVTAMTLKAWNVDTGETRVVSEGEIVEAAGLRVYEGSYYWVDAVDLTIKKIEMATGKITTVTRPVEMKEERFITLLDMRRGQILLDVSGEIQLLTFPGGERLPGPPEWTYSAGGRGGVVIPFAEYDGMYLVTYCDEMLWLPQYNVDGTVASAPQAVERYALISAEDYRAGVGNFIRVADSTVE